MTLPEAAAAARELLAQCELRRKYGGAVSRTYAETCARYILSLAPGKDAAETAQAIADGWTETPDHAAMLASEIAAALVAHAAKERAANCRAMCGLCEDGHQVMEQPNFITQGKTWVHDVDGKRHRCAAAAIHARSAP